LVWIDYTSPLRDRHLACWSVCSRHLVDLLLVRIASCDSQRDLLVAFVRHGKAQEQGQGYAWCVMLCFTSSLRARRCWVYAMLCRAVRQHLTLALRSIPHRSRARCSRTSTTYDWRWRWLPASWCCNSPYYLWFSSNSDTSSGATRRPTGGGTNPRR